MIRSQCRYRNFLEEIFAIAVNRQCPDRVQIQTGVQN